MERSEGNSLEGDLGGFLVMLDMAYCLLDTRRDLNKKFMPTVFVEESSCSYLFHQTGLSAIFQAL